MLLEPKRSATLETKLEPKRSASAKTALPLEGKRTTGIGSDVHAGAARGCRHLRQDPLATMHGTKNVKLPNHGNVALGHTDVKFMTRIPRSMTTLCAPVFDGEVLGYLL